MIEFRGELSEECKRYLLQQQFSMAFIIAPFSLLFEIPLVLLVVSLTQNKLFWLLLPFLILASFTVGLPPSKKDYSVMMPSRVYIEDELIVSESDRFHHERMVSEVVKVIDWGNFYEFRFSPRLRGVVCQKDLISSGTLTDFEDMFHDKIIRNQLKTKKKS